MSDNYLFPSLTQYIFFQVANIVKTKVKKTVNDQSAQFLSR